MKHKRFLGMVAAILLGMSIIGFPLTAYADTEGVFRSYLPRETGDVNWYFERPQGMAADIYGNIYVADTYNNRIQKFNSNGELITKWGTRGTDNGEFGYAYGIAVDKNGYVYVADTVPAYLLGDEAYAEGRGDCRIQKFDSNGKFIKKWGSYGSGAGQFKRIEGIAVDKDCNVYVTDVYNANVQKFDSNGKLLMQFGSQGTGNGQFAWPSGLAVDQDGVIFVADSHNHRIQKFDAKGKYLGKWGGNGYNGNGKFDRPYSVALYGGYVYIGDQETGRVQKFDKNGVFKQQWKMPSSDECFTIVADGYGNIYTSGHLSVYKYKCNGSLNAKWSSESNTDGKFFYIADMAFDSHDNMFVVDRNNHRIQKFDKNGNFLTKWSTEKDLILNGNYVQSIAIDSEDNVYILTDYIPTVIKYSNNGTFIKKWGKKGKGNGALDESPNGMVFDKNDNLYIADTYNSLVQVFTKDGQFIRQFGGNDYDDKIEDGETQSPRDVAIGKDGNIYVVNMHAHNVTIFDDKGIFVKSFGSEGNGDGQMQYPFGLAVDKEGCVYVADMDNHRVQKFDSEGNFLYKWGSKGNDINQFKHPIDVEIDHSDNVYVADESNSRIMWMPVLSKGVPQVTNVALKTSPTLGFSPGGIDTLPITVGIKTDKSAKLSAYVYNANSKWVAKIGVTISKSGQYNFSWDGKATKGNTSGLKAGSIVPVSSSGKSYSIKVYAGNANGSYWSPKQTIKLYSNPKISGVLASGHTLSAGKKLKFTYKVSRFCNTQVRIVNAAGKIVALYKKNLCFPSKTHAAYWDGKATAGNNAGLSTGAPLPAGKYKVQIVAGKTVYNLKSPVLLK
jgi:sugar lactone lactonase YvrE/flagellar hook assembly protein FlgD